MILGVDGEVGESVRTELVNAEGVLSVSRCHFVMAVMPLSRLKIDGKSLDPFNTEAFLNFNTGVKRQTSPISFARPFAKDPIRLPFQIQFHIKDR